MLRLLPSLLDPEDAAAFNLPHKESKVITMFVKTVLCIRRVVVRHFMLPRSAFLSRIPFYSNKEGKYVPKFYHYKPYIYKDGYSISELGPEKFKVHHNIEVPSGSCPVMHEL